MSRIPLVVLAAVALLNLGRGAFHALAPDSGAGIVAGFDLTTNSPTIIFLLASIGVSQFVWGILQAYVVLRERAFVVHLLALQTLLTGLSLANMLWWKPPPVTIPGEAGNIGLFAILVVTLLIALLSPRMTAKAA
jgi:hypothetical protein